MCARKTGVISGGKQVVRIAEQSARHTHFEPFSQSLNNPSDHFWAVLKCCSGIFPGRDLAGRGLAENTLKPHTMHA